MWEAKKNREDGESLWPQAEPPLEMKLYNFTGTSFEIEQI
jgi:hypothetical protein